MLKVLLVLALILLLLNFRFLAGESKLLPLATFFLLLFSVSVCFEELFHIAMIVIQGRKEEVSAIGINMMYCGAIPLIGLGISVVFKGNITSNDTLYIKMGGACLCDCHKPVSHFNSIAP
jgi:hypothetical protein